MQTKDGHILKLTCERCDRSETLFAPKRYMLIALMDVSLWHPLGRIDRAADGGHLALCATCHGTEITCAEHNEAEYKRQWARP